jgi:hypothetical protein
MASPMLRSWLVLVVVLMVETLSCPGGMQSTLVISTLRGRVAHQMRVLHLRIANNSLYSNGFSPATTCQTGP